MIHYVANNGVDVCTRSHVSKLTTVITVWTADVHWGLDAARCWQTPAPSPCPCRERGQETSTRSSRGPTSRAESQWRSSRVRWDGLSGRWESGEIGRYLSNWSNGAWTDVYGHVFLDGDGELFSFTHRHRAIAEREGYFDTYYQGNAFYPKRLQVQFTWTVPPETPVVRCLAQGHHADKPINLMFTAMKTNTAFLTKNRYYTYKILIILK